MVDPWTNYALADYIAAVNRARIRSMRSVRIHKTWIGIRMTHFLYIQGIFLSYKIEAKYIHIFFKFRSSRHILTGLHVVSKPSLRRCWTLKQLAKNNNVTNFTGFYIVSTQKGLYTSDYCLFQGHISGEVLVKVNL